MILDESLEVKISPITITDTSKGEKVEVDTLILKHPTPMMAKHTFKMRSYFIRMMKESEKALMGNMSKDAAEAMIAAAMQEKQKMQAGIEVKALHKEYADDAQGGRDSKLKEVAETEKHFLALTNSCVDVDFNAMINDFGKMLLDNKRCHIRCNEEGASEALEPLTVNIWTDLIDPQDRLEAAVKYCSFFGLTSNTRS